MAGASGPERTSPRSVLPNRITLLLNSLSDPDAHAALMRCCGSRRWADRVVAGRPYVDDAALLTAAEHEWWALDPADWREAFAAHPRIGQRTGDAWARSEQGGMAGADEATRRALAEGNAAYERRFGHVFLVYATGRSAPELLAELRRRLPHEPATELRVAAGEQAKITRLRMEKLTIS